MKECPMPGSRGASARHSTTVRRTSPYRRYTLLAVVIAAGLLVALVALLDLPLYPAWVAALSVVAFLAYGFDKRRAVSGGGRVPELVLHGLALAGGFPGGWLGRAWFHHKTRHTSFLVVLVLSTLLHAGIVWQLYLS
jgi:uncharacterized membrane protein YsdA (DUF1294 family)